MYENLKREIERKGISTKALANVCGCSEKSAWNKLNGETDFTLGEAMSIWENLMKEFDLKYLFARATA